MLLIRKKPEKGARATYGNLYAGDYECCTLELPWKNNHTNVSCIPVGKYRYKKLEESRKIKYPHIWIMDVEGRSGIKIHIANFVKQLKGCIAVGSRFEDIDEDGIIDVLDSKITLEELINAIPDTGWLEIKEEP